MKRRDFIKRSAPLLAAPYFLNGIPVKAFATGLSGDMAHLLSQTDRVLVLVQLSGGNDGINTVIPLDQYSAYTAARSNIAIPENTALKLTNSTGLHPAMTGIETMYKDGKVAIVQGVSYPSPNFSHFRATDIWLTASNSNEDLQSGWLGRYLSEEYPGFPDGYPNPDMPDPFAIQIGAVVSLGLQGPEHLLGIAIQDPESFYQLVSGGKPGGYDDPPNSPAGHELTYIRQVQFDAQGFATIIKAAADKAPNKATYPTGNALADQLKIVARLVAGGLKTRIYIVNIGGFDLHSSQIQVTPSVDPTLGSHATLLKKLSEAYAAFQQDLKLYSVEDRVLGMTFTEFGRRVNSNASYGTDHGTSSPMFLFGTKVQGGIVGTNPSLTNLDNGNLKMQYDFRQVYSSVLAQWFGVNESELLKIMLRDFPALPLIQTNPSAVTNTDTPADFTLEQNYPNPFASSTTITFRLKRNENVTVQVFDIRGNEIATLVRGSIPAGLHTTEFSAGGLPSGEYVYRIQAGSFRQTKRMMVRK